ncbi:WD40 repeat-like protein [Gyrodon lividus]|nr:WD40 repeat-like protein [Gyrodon lividus]
MTIAAHEDSIDSVAYLPGGKYIVTCSHDNTIKVWNVESGKQEGTTMKDDGIVQCLTITSDGKKMVTSIFHNNKVHVWDMDTQERIIEWGEHNAFVDCLAITPDDQLVASGDKKGMILVREIKEGGQIKYAIDTGTSRVTSLCFSPNGEKLPDIRRREWNTCPRPDARSFGPDAFSTVVARRRPALLGLPRLHDSAMGLQIWEPLEHTSPQWGLSLSPPGEFVASGGRDGILSIWFVPWKWDSQKQFAYLLERSVLHAAKGLWEESAQIAEQVIQVAPLSPLSYERKRVALHALGLYHEAFEASRTILALKRASEKDISHLERIIQREAFQVLRNAPTRLFNVTNGKLCDRAAQVSAFKSSVGGERGTLKRYDVVWETAVER